MTHTEAICNAMGSAAPNMDHESGIHYGVIPQNAVDDWSIDEIYTDGRDLGYEDALSEIKTYCNNAINAIADMQNIEDVIVSVRAWLSDYLDKDDIADISADITCGDITDGEELFNGIEDIISDTLSIRDESGPYYYAKDGVKVKTDSHGDLWVLKSPYYTECRKCSPCAPNAGYLTSDGSMRTYCLPHDWFDGDKAPYKVYSVKDGSEVMP